MNSSKPSVPGLPPANPAPLALPSAFDGGDVGGGAAALPLPLAGVLLVLGGVLLAGGAGYGLAWLMGVGDAGPWAAAAAGALGVAAAALPLGWLMFRLAADGEAASRGASGSAPQAGMARSLFLNLAEREWARARRYGTGAALLLVDVDRYARLCDVRGSGAGDAVLAELLRQTAPTLRTADVLTRFSDTQVAVFLAHADATGALDVAERIRERAEQLEVPWQPQRLRLTVSVGVAHLRPAHLNLQALIDDADEAVLAARNAGGNCVRAAPVESARSRAAGSWRDERRVRKSPPP